MGSPLSTPEARAERDAILLAWAMSIDLHDVALGAMGQHSGVRQDQTLEATVCFGQFSGSIDARETLLQQHLYSDPSLFVVNEVVPANESLMWRQVVAWTLKLARDEISKSLRSDHGYNNHTLEERYEVLTTALSMPAIRGAILGKLGRLQPGAAAITSARQSKSGLHPKAADCLQIYQGLRRFAPFALRRTISDAFLKRLGEQRLLELAGGLALAEALSVSSGHPLRWNSSIAADGVMAKVGPFSVGWYTPMAFDSDDCQLIVCAKDSRTNSLVSFIRCVDASGSVVEDEVIRLATQSLVAACRNEVKLGPRYEETPLAHCAIVMRRLYSYKPEAINLDKLLITEFEQLACGRLLELAHRIHRRASLS
jgi:hypothetical protein